MGQYVPTGHDCCVLPPAAGQYLPGTQGIQTFSESPPVVIEYVPGGHGVGTPIPLALQYVPGGQGAGSVEPIGNTIVPFVAFG